MANFRDKDHRFLAVRGGSWGNYRDFARVSIRFFDHPDSWSNLIGFRVAALRSEA